MKRRRINFKVRFWSVTRKRSSLRVIESFFQHNGLVSAKSMLSNIMMIASSLFTSVVYDRVIPTRSEYTLWILGSGVLLAIGLELALKFGRAKLMDHIVVGMDNRLSREIFSRLLDFDDCGFGWFLYDLAAALSFIETDPAVPALQQAWLEGYRQVRELSAEDIAMGPAMILLRRMVLLAWIGSHAETDLARSQAPHFAAGTAELARRWLGGDWR